MRIASQPIPQVDAAARPALERDLPLQTSERERAPARPEKRIDDTLKDTFPASDPPATGGVTRIDPEPEPPARRSPEPDEPGTA
ncbi:hypothetical protein [Burkholderia glumae]|uniref:hypothetical protein n=1 Tax=Burkholderia glumae TaxID=337 RepID=UPI002868EC6F|nr:hypothetical protein [Burkholderia glumae]